MKNRIIFSILVLLLLLLILVNIVIKHKNNPSAQYQFDTEQDTQFKHNMRKKQEVIAPFSTQFEQKMREKQEQITEMIKESTINHVKQDITELKMMLYCLETRKEVNQVIISSNRYKNKSESLIKDNNMIQERIDTINNIILEKKQ